MNLFICAASVIGAGLATDIGAKKYYPSAQSEHLTSSFEGARYHELQRAFISTIQPQRAVTSICILHAATMSYKESYQ
jgi:hypothetical protein